MKNAIKIKKSNNIKLSNEDFNNIIKIVTFDKIGTYYTSGRTCYYLLKSSIIIDNKKYSYIKIKGNGFFENKEYKKPSNSEFLRIDPHYGFDNNDKPILVNSKSAPLGGILLKRALNEFNNFNLLRRHHVSTLYPIYVFEYNNLKFKGQKLGIIVALSEEPYRFDKLLFSNIPNEYLKFYKKVFYNEFGYNTSLDFKDKSKLIQQISYKYAKEIRKFSNSGLYIHSGGWSNIQYSFADKNIVLVDLDSSTKNKSNKKLVKYRDLVSNIYRLFINLYHPNCIQDYTEEILKETNYCYYLLKGYFDEINDETLFLIADKINDYYINKCFKNIKIIEKIMTKVPKEQQKKMELKIFDFYNYCMSLICKYI